MTKKNSFDLMKYSRVLLLVIIVLVMCLLDERFRTVSNMRTIIEQQVPYMFLLSSAMTMAIISGTIDLSLGSVMGLSACVGAYFFYHHDNYVVGILAAFGVGIAAGLINTLMVVKIGIPPFITTYGMDWILKGLAYILTAGKPLYTFRPEFRVIATGDVFGISNLFWIMIVVVVLLYLLLNRTTYGRNFYAAGINRNATKISGVNTNTIIMVTYVLNGILATVTGLLYTARMDVAEASLCEGWNIKLFASVLIGGTPMTGGKGGILQTLVGVTIMIVITNGLNILGVSSLWQNVATGCVLLFAIILEVLSDRLNKRLHH